MATELAKAYVQIIPSAQGIKGKLTEALSGEAGNAGDSAGLLAGSKLVSKIKTAIATAGIGQALKSAITEGAAMEQSLGGIETLFKGSADKVIKNAQQAYRTAGMSANQYMKTVTSFSASLLQGLSGDTNKAADVADMALTDMSDNANKMGTSMELIQNAYQGFAKQNYTMLDNLKLGYGGTKTEMQRLLADAQKLTGVKYDINNLSDVYSAIHVIQEEIGITGTTAKEASVTFSGSFAAMKGAVKTFLGNLALGEDVSNSLRAVLNTTETFIFDNFIPMVGNIVLGIGNVLVTTDWGQIARETIGGLCAKFSQSAREILGTDGSIIDAVIDSINTRIPMLLQEGITMIDSIVKGILNNLPSVIASAGTLVSEFLNCIFQNLPKILSGGVTLVINIVNGIINSLPKIISSGVNLVTQLLTTILSNAPRLIESGLTLIGKVAAGLIQAVPNLISKIPGIISQIKSSFTSIDWGSIGSNIISGIVRGLLNGVSSIVDAARNVAQQAFDAAKRKLDINSPSGIFEHKIGEMIPLGMVKGIRNKFGTVVNTVRKLNDNLIDVTQSDLSYSSSGHLRSSGNSVEKIGDYIVDAIIGQGKMQANAIKEGISNIRMVPNEREFVRFVNGLA